MGVTLHTYAHSELNWDSKLVPVSGSGGDSDLERIAAAMNFPAAMPSNDFNAVTQSGIYTGSSLSNAPGGSGNLFFVHVIYRDSANISQTAMNINTGTYWVRKYQGGSWTAWDQIATASTLQGLIGDTGWVTTTGITAVSGYTVTASKYRIRNGLAMVGVSGAKNATAVTVGAAGSIANSAFAQLPALLIPSATNGIVVNNGSAAGFAATGYASQATGQLIFTTAPAGIPASGALDAYAEYYL